MNEVKCLIKENQCQSLSNMRERIGFSDSKPPSCTKFSLYDTGLGRELRGPFADKLQVQLEII